MREKGSHLVCLRTEDEIRHEMREIGVSAGGIECMTGKARFYGIKVKDISCRSANILKQEMLSRGGEAAVSARTVYAEGNTDVLLLGTALQLTYLAEKLEKQPLGLRNVAEAIRQILDGIGKKDFSFSLPDGKTLTLPENTTRVMGIVNITPDSFSDGGRYFSPKDAIRQAETLWEDGADILDLGAVSSRPQAVFPDAEEEWRRLCPVIRELGKQDMVLSVDTFRGTVAERCLEAGVHIVNDIGGFRMDAALAGVVARWGCPVAVMHNRMQVNAKPYEDFLSDVVGDLQESVQLGIEAGVKPEQLILDPGIGFGKTPAQNRLLIQNLAIFQGMGYPLLLGLSRKSFLADMLPGLSLPEERDDASLALGIMGALNGARILRVHEVKKAKQAMQIIDKVRNEKNG